MRYMYLVLALAGCLGRPRPTPVAAPAPPPPCKSTVPTLIGGTPVTDGYEEVVVINTGSRCTATIVSPTVVLTAAHCGVTGVRVLVSYGSDQLLGTFRATAAVDLGAVVLDEAIQAPYASVYLEELKAGLSITILGYGCEDGVNRVFGTLRQGQTQIFAFEPPYLLFYGQPALCYGDSGGPVFLTGQSSNYIIGVHSRGNISDRSLSVQLGTPLAKAFLQELAADHDLCGINRDCAPDPKPAYPCGA